MGDVIQTNFTYRTASLNDKEQLKQLGLLSYGQYAPVLTTENLEKLKAGIGNDERWIELLTKSKSFVCEHENKIIGMAFIVPNGNPWDIFKVEWSYIRMVGVDPEYSGKGIAKALTKLCINHAKATNEKTIALHTSEFMNAALHIYEDLGFKILQEIDPRFGKKYWLYTLDLS